MCTDFDTASILGLACLFHELARQKVVEKAQQTEYDDGDRTDQPKRGAAGIDAQKDGRPGGVEGGAHRRRGEEATQLGKVAQGLRCARKSLIGRGLDGGGQDRQVHQRTTALPMAWKVEGRECSRHAQNDQRTHGGIVSMTSVSMLWLFNTLSCTCII